MFIDTHAHLYAEELIEDIDNVIKRANNLDVNKIFMPNIDSSSIKGMNTIATKFPDVCYPMMGLHPCYVKENYKSELDRLVAELDMSTYYGIGETGIDLHWDVTFKKQQIDSFEFQIELAKKHKLPIIIHSRESLDLTIEIIKKYQDGSIKGIFHCFNGTLDQCKKVADLGFMMGLGGIITFKKANLGDMVHYLPKEHMLLETDAPYLSPTPHRGKTNESSYIPLVAMKIAEFKGIAVAEVKEITTNNAQNLFDI